MDAREDIRSEPPPDPGAVVGVGTAESLARLALAGAATADPDAAAIWRKNLDERRQAMTMFAAELASTGRIRPDHSVETVVDVLWLAMDVRNYDVLVRERGWPPERFQRWYVDTVAAAILTPGGGGPPASAGRDGSEPSGR